ncbi:MAG: family 78 glycoside hydrolase catalytic domain [Candidatus Cryptobacteroides sp.]
MMKRIVLLTTLIPLLMSCGTDRLEVYDLRCENLVNPLGLATSCPRFSWKFNAPAGVGQTALEIQVASSEAALERGEADLWLSGRVESDAQILVPYEGVSLESLQLCFWRVRIWDSEGKASRWSGTCTFSIGALAGLRGDYIGMPSDNGESPIFRTTFNVSPGAERVFAHVNSLGYHELYVNGEKVGENVLSPAVSQLDKHSLILTYDITSYVGDGANDIAVWLGQGWYKPRTFNALYGGPLLKAQIDELVSGTWDTISATGPGWTAVPGGYQDTGTWEALRFGGERVDGNIVPQDLSADVLDGLRPVPVEVVEVPGMQATPQTCERNAIICRSAPVSLARDSAGRWILDMGRVLTGWLKLDMHGLAKGQEIKMEYSDYQSPEGVVDYQGESDIYIAAGRSEETFCNKFNHHAYRYVRISGLTERPEAEALQVSGDYTPASSFKCSDDDLNAVHDMISYTMRCLAFSGYMVDCPHLERTGYGGDGNSSTMTLQTMYNVAPLYSNWLSAWRDVVEEDGGLPHVAPAGGGGGGPYWCGFIVLAPFRTWLNYADDGIARNTCNEMAGWLEYVRKYSPDGLLHRWPDTRNRMWYLGDWLAPSGVDAGNQKSVDLVSNCLVSECLQAMGKMSFRLGNVSEVEGYRIWNENLSKRIHDTFYNPADSTYGSGSPLDMAYPMNVGIVPEELRPAVREKMRRISYEKYNGHIAVGLVGVPIFTEYAVRFRETRLMYDILKQRDYPGYLYMIDNGASATWESWDAERSRVHNCYNGIGTWFYQALAGIIPDEPGYRHFIIDPQYLEELSWVKAGKETPYGTVSVEWKRQGTGTVVNVRIPSGSSAAFKFPQNSVSRKVNGKNLDGIQTELSSGYYTIAFQNNTENQ